MSVNSLDMLCIENGSPASPTEMVAPSVSATAMPDLRGRDRFRVGTYPAPPFAEMGLDLRTDLLQESAEVQLVETVQAGTFGVRIAHQAQRHGSATACGRA